MRKRTARQFTKTMRLSLQALNCKFHNFSLETVDVKIICRGENIIALIRSDFLNSYNKI